ncbi:MAG: flagellar hook-length control protein FliK [Nitrospiria bacterium]
MSITLESNKAALQVIDTGNAEKSASQAISETGLHESMLFHQVLGEMHREGNEQVQVKIEIEGGSAEKNGALELTESRDLKEIIPLEKTLADRDVSIVIEEVSGQSKMISAGEDLPIGEVKKESSNRVSVQNTVQENETKADAIRVNPLSVSGIIPFERSEHQNRPGETEKNLFYQEETPFRKVKEGYLPNKPETELFQENKKGPFLSSVSPPKEPMTFKIQDQEQNQDGLLTSALQNDNEMLKDTIQSVKNPLYSQQFEVMNNENPKNVPETNRERLHPSQSRSTLSEKEIGKNSERILQDTFHSEGAVDVNKAGGEITKTLPREMAETSEAISKSQRHRNLTTSHSFNTAIETSSTEGGVKSEGLLNKSQKGRMTDPTVDVVPDVLTEGRSRVPGVMREPSTSDMRAAVVVNTDHKSAVMNHETNFDNGLFDRSVEKTSGNLDGRIVSASTDASFSPDLKAVLPSDNLVKPGNTSIPKVRSLESHPVLKDSLLHEIQAKGVEQMTVSEGGVGSYPMQNQAKRHFAQALPISSTTDSPITEKNAFEMAQGSNSFQDRPTIFSAIDFSSPVGEKDVQKAILSENEFQDLKVSLPNEDTILRQISDQIRLWKPSKETNIRLQLKPETLGSLQIEMQVEDNSVIARIVTEDVSVKGLIEGNKDLLRHGLEGQGFKIERFSVDVGGMARSFNQREGESFSDRKAQDDYPPKEGVAPAQNQAFKSSVVGKKVKGRGVLNLYA